MIQDVRLMELQKKVSRNRELTSELKQLYLHQKELEAKADELELLKINEQRDVDKLEKKGLTALFYGMMGKKDAKLDKERQEARAAAMLHGEAVQKLECINESIRAKEAEAAAFKECQAEFDKLLEEKRALIKNAGGSGEAQLIRLESEVLDLKHRQNIIDEVIELGQEILKNIADTKETLNAAEDTAVKEAFAGSGSLVMNVQKGNYLGKAQEKAAELKEQLARFGAGLEEVSVTNDMDVKLDAIFQFGNEIYMYWIQSSTVMEVTIIERIRTAKGLMKKGEAQVKDAVQQLAEREERNEKELNAAKERLEKVISNYNEGKSQL